MTLSDAKKYVETYLSNLQPCSLTFLAGRPESGKTQIGIAVAQSYAPALYFSYEMPEEILRDRILGDVPIQICDGLPDLQQLKEITRQAIKDTGIKLVVIDYFELLFINRVTDPLFECALPSSYCNHPSSELKKNTYCHF